MSHEGLSPVEEETRAKGSRDPTRTSTPPRRVKVALPRRDADGDGIAISFLLTSCKGETVFQVALKASLRSITHEELLEGVSCALFLPFLGLPSTHRVVSHKTCTTA
jgi:hypothetical protein